MIVLIAICVVVAIAVLGLGFLAMRSGASAADYDAEHHYSVSPRRE
jgi:hypothetical protein